MTWIYYLFVVACYSSLHAMDLEQLEQQQIALHSQMIAALNINELSKDLYGIVVKNQQKLEQKKEKCAEIQRLIQADKDLEKFATAIQQLDIDAVVKNETLLCAATSKQLYYLVQLVLEAGADINKVSGESGNNCLMYAVRGAPISVVRWLLRQGVRAEFTNNNGYTPLSYALWHYYFCKWEPNGVCKLGNAAHLVKNQRNIIEVISSKDYNMLVRDSKRLADKSLLSHRQTQMIAFDFTDDYFTFDEASNAQWVGRNKKRRV